MTTSLLHYRGWHGQFRSSWYAVWPIARVALATLLRRRMFWLIYSAGLLLFLMFFMGTYLLDWAETQIPDAPIQIGKFKSEPGNMVGLMRRGFRILNGSRETFSYFFMWQATIVVVALALAGSIVLGNDFTHRSVAFYLSKPIGRWHYLLGKGLAIAVVVNMLTTLPALLLYVQHGFDDYKYFIDGNYFEDGGPSGWLLLLGVLSYGAILSLFLSIFLLAVATAVRRTVPLVMAWTSLFLFLRILANLLVGVMGWDHHWRLFDLWNNMSLLGRGCLGYDNDRIPPTPQPSFLAAGLTLVGVSAVCLIYLNRRTRAVDIIR